MTFARIAAAVFAAAATASATPIGLADFDGTEHRITFDDVAPFSGTNTLALQGVTFAAGGGLGIQHPFSGGAIGTNGAALNEHGTADHDIALTFDHATVQFGANYGVCYWDCGTASATISAYDGMGNVVESVDWGTFDNGFVGFDFASSVTPVEFHRYDGSGFYSFLDDVRYVDASVDNGGGSGDVPEPASLALLGLGAAGALLARRRR